MFETLLGPDDAVISDALNHASIIDGIRLCKANRLRYEHDNLEDLEQKLKESQGARLRMIATDGVFSMDGDIARLDRICDLAEKHQAMVMVDDSHATGFVGKTGRGTHEFRGVMGRVDIITSTLGKALGGASGGFTSGRKRDHRPAPQPLAPLPVQQHARPHDRRRPAWRCWICSPPAPACGTRSSATRSASAPPWRKAGFDIRPGTHPIAPIMLGEAKLAVEFARRLLEEGIYVIGFSYPVVPQGKARIRVQISAAHSESDIDRAVAAFTKVGRELEGAGSAHGLTWHGFLTRAN